MPGRMGLLDGKVVELVLCELWIEGVVLCFCLADRGVDGNWEKGIPIVFVVCVCNADLS